MNKKAMEGLKQEEEIKNEIYDTKKSIRHLEIELDYEDSRRGNNYKYIKSLETQIDEQYIKLDSLYEIKGLRKSTGWTLYISHVGDDTGITFNITSLGQVQYISSDMIDWVSTTMKFKALTTSM